MSLPAAKKVDKPHPNHGRGQKELSGSRHQEEPCTAHQSQQFDSGRRRGDVKREECQADEDNILHIRELEMMLLQVSHAVPHVEGCLQASDVLLAPPGL